MLSNPYEPASKAAPLTAARKTAVPFVAYIAFGLLSIGIVGGSYAWYKLRAKPPESRFDRGPVPEFDERDRGLHRYAEGIENYQEPSAPALPTSN